MAQKGKSKTSVLVITLLLLLLGGGFLRLSSYEPNKRWYFTK